MSEDGLKVELGGRVFALQKCMVCVGGWGERGMDAIHH